VKFSEQLWQNITPIYNNILQHPFIQELIRGDLPTNKFIFYLQQDELYLKDFSQALTLAGKKTKSKEDYLICSKFAQEALTAELELHESFFTKFNIISTTQKSVACSAYTKFLLDITANQTFPIAAAALLPCFWIYFEVGKFIAAQASLNNPYELWINLYSGIEFEQSVKSAIDLVDRAALRASQKELQQMQYVFNEATQLEWKFWDSAYNL
jgi:thiaminase/transcriptional activator TenA